MATDLLTGTDADNSGASSDLLTGTSYDVPANQMQGPWREPALAGSYALKGAENAAGQAGDVRNLFQSLLTKAGMPQSVAQYFPSPFAAVMPNMAFSPTSAQTVGSTDALGLTNRPDLKPQGTGEKYLAAGSEGVGGSLPYLLTGGAGAVAPTLISGATGGMGSQFGSDMFPNNPWASLGFGVLGGGVGAGGGNLLTRAGNAITGNVGPVLEAMKRLDITPRLIGDVTGNRAAQGFQMAAEKLPFGGRVPEAAQETAQDFGKAVDRTADKLNPNVTTSMQAGQVVQDAGQQWLNGFKKEGSQLWDAVDQAIPADTRVDVSNYSDALKNVQNTFTEAKSTADTLQSPLSKNLTESLTADLKGGTTLPWSDVKALRTQIGEKLATPQLVGDSSYSELKRIYAGLTTDMEGAAHAQGALTDFDKASAFTKNGHQFIEDRLSGIMDKDPDAVVTSSLNNASTLQDLRTQMPDAADALGAYHLRRSATPPDSQRVSGTPYSPYTFNTSMGPKHLSPEARQALYGGNSDVSQSVSDLDTVGQSIKDTVNRYRNSSGSAGTLGHNMLWTAPIAIKEAYDLGGPWAAGAAALPYAAGPLTGLAAVPPRLLGRTPIMNFLSARGATGTQPRSLLMNTMNQGQSLLNGQ